MERYILWSSTSSTITYIVRSERERIPSLSREREGRSLARKAVSRERERECDSTLDRCTWYECTYILPYRKECYYNMLEDYLNVLVHAAERRRRLVYSHWRVEFAMTAQPNDK